MRSLFAFLLTALLGLALIACSGDKQTQETQQEQAEPQMEAATAQPDSLADVVVCPACGMEHPMAEMIAYETEEGDTIYFCSDNCQKLYLAQQEQETTE